MVREENIETALMVTSIIPASTTNSDYHSTAIIAQNNQPEPIYSALINLYISHTLHKAKNLDNGNRCDYGRSQSAEEGQGSVDDSQNDELCHSEADNTVLTSNRAETATRSISGHLKSQPEGIQQHIAAQRVPDPCRSVEKLHEFLPNCEEVLGHPNTCKLLNGWHPFMEKKNMMLLTA
ncbi:hypothetical protein O181_088388 [Austropuccinia psidii MF-1]|uniref:Uncharacterized protein n=1 Tax=Austropuccinia psidii MF-1 TaxID=1389203 RepID=A0A9Q3P2S0_9BASI|nr:hypothetical protein [Austropuccinia psidii MF-1]